jgi:hypothetical protein
VPLPGEISPLSGGEKSAEAIVVEETSRSADEHSKIAGATHPMKGRTNEEGIDPATDKPTDNARVRGELESRGGGKHGAPQGRTMIEDILEPENLAAAWKRVKANKGAPGIDGMSVGDFPAFARGHWPRIATAIREGSYRPAPVKRVWIPKPDGSKRPLGIPDGTREATPQGVPQGGPLSPLLANIALDPLDKELEARGHQFARYADDFIVLVKSANAAKRVLAALIRFCEGRLGLVVNRAKSRAAPLKQCVFLGYRIDNKGKLAWTEKAQHRFKERVREITSRNRGHRAKDVIDELRLYVRGWLNYYKLSSTYTEVLDLSQWVRRRVRLYYWKQWKQPRTRRRNLLALGISPDRVHLATRSRKGYWRMSQNELVRIALNNRWLEEQGVPDMRAVWIVLHYGPDARV